MPNKIEVFCILWLFFWTPTYHTLIRYLVLAHKTFFIASFAKEKKKNKKNRHPFCMYICGVKMCGYGDRNWFRRDGRKFQPFIFIQNHATNNGFMKTNLQIVSQACLRWFHFNFGVICASCIDFCLICSWRTHIGNRTIWKWEGEKKRNGKIH